MGLKLFRADLSMEKEAAKIPAMAGLYRRISYSESNPTLIVWESKSEAMPPSTSTSADDKRAQYNNLKADLKNRLSSPVIIEWKETVAKDHGEQPQIHNRASEDAGSSTSIEDSNIKEQSLTREESNNINNQNKDQNNITDNELVI